MRERGARLVRELARLAGTLAAVAVLLVVGVLVVGAVVGPAHPERGASVDPADPAPEVVADGVRELTWQNHRVETTLVDREPNETRAFRGVTAVDHDRRYVRFAAYGRATSADGTVAFGPPRRVLFGGDGQLWQRTDGRWRRVWSGYRGPVAYGTTAEALYPPAAVERLPFRTVSRNRSALVLRANSTTALRKPAASAMLGRNTTATAVVDLAGDPSLRRLTFRNRSGPGTRTKEFRFSGVGETRVERPDPMPPASATELLFRAARGVERVLTRLGAT